MADLVSLANVKHFLGETTSYADAELAILIAAASGLIQRRIDPVVNTAYTEIHDGRGDTVLMLRHWPLIATDPTRKVLLGAVDITDQCTWDLRLGRVCWPAGFTMGVQNVTVAYTAGLGETVPADIATACTLMVAAWVKSDLGAVSIDFQPAPVGNSSRGLFARAMEILESYPSYRR